MMIKRSPIAFAICSLAMFLMAASSATFVSAQDEFINWEKDWKEAVRRAKDENKAIMIHFNMDNEPACIGISRGHFKNKQIVELSKKFVCVVGSLGDHAEEEIFPGTDGTCKRFGTVTCAEHRQTESAARSDIMQTTTVTAPQFVFCTPDGKVLVRRPWDLPPSELIELMNRALYYFNPDLSPEEAAKRAKENLDELLRDAASDNAATRKKALDALAKRDDPAIIEFLIGQTSGDVDEVKRNEAVQAIGEAANANCLPCLIDLLGDRSTRLRKNTLIALSKLGMRECVPAVIKAYGVENSDINQAIAPRTVAVCDPDGEEAHKFLKKALGSRRELVRAHAIRSFLDAKMDNQELAKVSTMVKGDTDTTVRAVASYVGASIALRVRQLGDLTGTYTFFEDPKGMQKTIDRQLTSSLKKVAAGDRSDNLRAYADQCLKVVMGDEDADHVSGILEFFKEDEIFEDEETKKARRGGGGGGRR